MRAHVLVVEDDAANRTLVERLLHRGGYRTTSFADGAEALAAVTAIDPDLVLLDVGLPSIDGLDVTRRLRADHRLVALPIVLLTGRTSVEAIVEGLDAGADDYVHKPFHAAELLARVRSALRLRQALARMDTAHLAVAALANAVEAKDPLTERHCQRLANLATRVGARAGLDAPELESLAYGALLHDVGKIGVPEAILTKAAPLSDDEWDLMRRHPEIGERICAPLSPARTFAPIVRHHHERWDGHGYPDGLRGEAIPIGARIVGVVDAYDALTHDRPYREAASPTHAIDVLRGEAGRQFDRELVGVLAAEVEHEATDEWESLPPTALIPTT